MNKVNVAVVGATGMVGSTFLKVLEDLQVPVGELVVLASERSVGKKVQFKGQDYEVELLTEEAFDPKRFQYALFSAGGGVSTHFAPIAARAGITVIDNSSAWRMDPNVPLVVPEVNFSAIGPDDHLIANPNCSTIQSVLPLKVIDDLFGVRRVVYTTYQAVSGSGFKGTHDLERTLRGEAPQFYRHPMANNVLPEIDVFLDNGYTKDEQKMIDETRKILENDAIAVSATCVRVPVANSHSVAMNVTTERPLDMELLRRTLAATPGIRYTGENEAYPTPLQATGQDDVLVGRLRLDDSFPNTLHLWCVADNIRKGAASNAVQILKRLMEVRS